MDKGHSPWVLKESKNMGIDLGTDFRPVGRRHIIKGILEISSSLVRQTL